ncbi:MAG: CBS domain-containing protein [Haloarculaceae archaeon]
MTAPASAYMTTPVLTAGERMTREVVTVSPDDAVARAVAVMREEDVGHLPVVDDRVVGILTETDLATYLAETRAEPAGAE